MVIEGDREREKDLRGCRSRWRQRKKYLDDLVATIGCLRRGELLNLTQDRERDSNAC